MTSSKQRALEELTALPHLSPDLAAKAWDDLGVRSIDDLVEAASAGRLQTLGGIGAKKEKAILEAAKGARKRNGKSKPAAAAHPMVDAALGKKYLGKLGKEKVLRLYHDMLLLRRFEEVAGRQYQMGKIKGFCHLYIGQEAVAVGAMAAIEERDHVITAYREHGHALARGVDPNAIMAELFGKATGSSGGIGGSMHIFDVSKNFYGGWGIVGGHIPTAAGIAFATKYRGVDDVTLCFLGDGSIHQGVVHETMNMASLWDLPVVLITENNQYAMGTALDRASAITDIERKAVGYDIDHAQIDGQDIFKVIEGIGEAVARARKHSRPSFLDVVTYRYRGHSMSDPAKYRTKEELQEHQEAGPLVRMHAWLLDAGVSTEDELTAMDTEIKALVKESVKFADVSPQPDPSVLTKNVYVEWPWQID